MKKLHKIHLLFIILFILVIPIASFTASDPKTDWICPVTQNTHAAYSARQTIIVNSWDETYHYCDYWNVTKCRHTYPDGTPCPYEDEQFYPNTPIRHKKGSLNNTTKYIIKSNGPTTHSIVTVKSYNCEQSGCGYKIRESSSGSEKHKCISHQYLTNNMYRHICQCGASKVAPYNSHY